MIIDIGDANTSLIRYAAAADNNDDVKHLLYQDDDYRPRPIHESTVVRQFEDSNALMTTFDLSHRETDDYEEPNERYVTFVFIIHTKSSQVPKLFAHNLLLLLFYNFKIVSIRFWIGLDHSGFDHA